MSLHILPIRVYLAVFTTLLVLTAVTVWAAFQDFGALNNLVAMAIAGVKASVVVLYFMHVRYSSKLIAMVVVGTIFFLSILFVFLLADGSFAMWVPTAANRF